MAGLTGSKGDSSGISAYAERYVHTPKTQELMANTETVVVLDVTGPSIMLFIRQKMRLHFLRLAHIKLIIF